MPTKYSDIIRIRAGKPAYNIEEERGDEWTSFIPNEQFNSVLKTVLRAVRGNDIDVHKSFWVNGTYGTGKSHAAAVIAHLLGDNVDEIRSWIDYEYKDEKFAVIKNNIYKLRENKRLLTIRIKGMVNLTHVSELAPVVQTKVLDALEKNSIQMEVATDYDTLINHVNGNEVIWNDIIRRNASLSSIVADRENLLKKLADKDAATLRKARAALRDASLMAMMPQENLGNWLLEVQERLRRTTNFTGLLILWDEFTEVMEDAVGIPVLNALQGVSEKFMSAENDSFIFLISHASAFNTLGAEATKHADGRFHRMKYNMEPVSAFKIMSRKFEIIDDKEHNSRRKSFYNHSGDLLNLYTAKSNDKQETREDLLNLFPIHPGTANLATHYATTVGSSSRSVFEFIGDNEKMRQFLDDEQAFANKDTITADFLWDFVLKEFTDDVAKYGAVTERWNTYAQRVAHQGAATEAAFKAILLLNAFNNVASDESVTPNEENVRHLFDGTRYEAELDEVLNWINEQGVVQRSPGGIFSVQFSALPSHEIEEIKEQLYSGDFRYTSQVLKFGDTASNFFQNKYVQRAIRPFVFDFFSESTNDSIVKNNIKTFKKNARPSDLCLILFFARDNDELGHLRQLAEECSQSGAQDEDKELKNIVYIVVDTPFGKQNYDRFIEYMASYTAAGNHGFMDQVNVHRNHASEMINEWMKTAQRGNCTIRVNGAELQISLKHLSSTLKDEISPRIFPKAPDALEILRLKAPSTFWKPQVSREIIRTFIFANNKEELLNVNTVMKPIQHFVQDALDENLEWKSDMPQDHQLKAVFDFMNDTIKNFISHGNTSQLFDFTERFGELTRPPFGLSANYASAAAVAFAMRPWVNKIYDAVGKPRDADNLAEDITLLFKFWDTGKSGNKLGFKFQTPQEGKLCNDLVSLFRLNKLQGYNDISSMKDARFAITGVFIEQQGYPLWSLKYMTDDFVKNPPKLTMNDEVKQLIDNVVAICEEKDQRNVQLVNNTLSLIAQYRFDFPDILSKDGSFENGFHNFLMQQANVALKYEEIADAKTFIKQNLQSSVGYWTEREVVDKLKDWRLDKQIKADEAKRQSEEAEQRKQEEQNRRNNEEERKLNEENVVPKKVQAHEHIDSISSPEELRAIIDRLIDLGYEQILDIILNKK